MINPFLMSSNLDERRHNRRLAQSFRAFAPPHCSGRDGRTGTDWNRHEGWQHMNSSRSRHGDFGPCNCGFSIPT